MRRTTMAKNKIKKKVIRDMHAEMNSSGMKDMWAMTALNPQMPNAQKLRILSKEEVYRQLIQVMTMAGAWAQSMRSARQPVTGAITK
jgi:hypothetical protein